MTEKIERREFLKYLLTSGIVLTSTGGISSLLSGCEKGKEVSVESIYDFLDHLNEAEIVTPGKEYVKRTSFTINREAREVLFEHPDSTVTFRDVSIHKDARLSFGIGINEPAWDKEGDGVLFEIILTDDKSQKHPLYSRYIDPKNNPDDRKWFDEVVDLKAFEGKNVSFTFKTSSGPKGNKACDWAGWSEPQISSQKLIRVKRKHSPNVILISIDTLRPDYLGCYGQSMNISPYVDKLAGRGVLFKNAIAQSPWTLPSHMSILTSLYPAVHLVQNDISVLPEERISLVEILKGEGYYTAAFVDGGYLSHKYGYSQGFDVYDDTGGHIKKINKKMMRFLEEHFQKQFFLFMHVFDVHGPYQPPSPYNKMFYKGNKEDPDNHSMDFLKEIDYHKYQKFDDVTDINYIKALYAGSVSYVDNELGKLFTMLEKLNVFDNTLIVFLSDHGESLFEHHIYMGHGLFLYDNEVKIPLIIKPPASNHEKTVINNQVESIDVMPTILDLLDIPQSKEGQGRSLAKCMRDTKFVEEDHYAFGESSNTGGTPFIRSNKWKFIAKMKKDVNEVIRIHLKPSSKIDLTHYVLDEEQLYDLERDPLERINLISKEAGIAEELRKRLSQWEDTNKKLASSLKKQGGVSWQKPSKPKLTAEEKEKLRALGYVQ